MRTRARFVAVCFAAVALVSGACGSVAPYAATVDGRRITSDDLEDELRSIASNEAYVRLIGQTRDLAVTGSGRGTFDASIAALTLTRQIYYHLVESELAERKLRVTTGDLNEARAAVKMQFASDPSLFGQFPVAYQDTLVRREAELAVLTLAINEVKSPDEAAKAYYDANAGEFTKACVRHILVASQERAGALGARVGAGESFEELAKAESADPGSAPNGGLVSCDITAESPDFPQPFLAAAFSQPVGVAGPPVQTEFGVHLIKVDSRGLTPYPEAAPLARASVLAQGEENVQSVLREAIAGARIVVNPRYGRFDRTGPSPAVVPEPPPEPITGQEPEANQTPSEPGSGETPAPDAGP